MKRRDFLKFLGIGGVGAGAGFLFSQASRQPGAKLIPYLVPPEDIIPGVPAWYASLCSECSAGCGTLVKIMDGRARKIEGNPKHPVNKGKLCALGQASLQGLYNPDRIKGPLKRSGNRGSGSFTEITWEEGIQTLAKALGSASAEKTHLMTSPIGGHLNGLVSAFMNAYGSKSYQHYALYQRRNLSHALNAAGFDSIPHFDIENTNYLLSFGADFTSSWISPVGYGAAYGRMRQGGGEAARVKRGKLVQVEPRMSLAGANADEWVPARPGTEAVLALSIAYAMVEKGYSRASDSGSWRGALAAYAPKDAAAVTDVPAERIYELAREFGQTRPSLAICGDNAEAYENGLACAVAVNVLNHLAGNMGIKGGVVPNPSAESRAPFKGGLGSFVEAAFAGKIKNLLVYDANPVFTAPAGAKVTDALSRVDFIASFSAFMDETAAQADLILPAHHPLEDWGDDFADPSVGYFVATIRQPAVSPTLNTRGLGDIFIALSEAMGGKMKGRFGANFAEHLKDGWKAMYSRNRDMSSSALTFEDFWRKALAEGGWWRQTGRTGKGGAVSVRSAHEYVSTAKASAFDGDQSAYPLYLTVYQQNGLRDGSGANRPWLQELPDPMTSVVWGTWVEINPKTAAKLGIAEGDLVSVESPHGKISAPAYIYPAIRPDTIGIPIGQGHTAYGRYAKDRGVNPISILPFKEDKRTGAPALNSTRVKVVKVSSNGELAKTEGTPREFGRGIVQTLTTAEFEGLGRSGPSATKSH